MKETVVDDFFYFLYTSLYFRYIFLVSVRLHRVLPRAVDGRGVSRYM